MMMANLQRVVSCLDLTRITAETNRALTSILSAALRRRRHVRLRPHELHLRLLEERCPMGGPPRRVPLNCLPARQSIPRLVLNKAMHESGDIDIEIMAQPLGRLQLTCD